MSSKLPKGHCPITRTDLSNRERMTRGFAYSPFPDPELVEGRRVARELFGEYNTTEGKSEAPKRLNILTKLLGTCGDGTFIEPPFRCDYGYNIHLGKKFYANFGCCFLDCGPITIGDNTMCGPSVQIYTATHPLDPMQRKAGVEGALQVTIGNNVWIGGGAVILPNVTIGDNSVIGAGSVVTKNVPPNCVFAGNPAVMIREFKPTDVWQEYPDKDFP